MKIRIEKQDLQNMLSRAQNVVDKRNNMPVLINVLLEVQDKNLQMFATDLETSLNTTCPAEVFENGRVVVNAKSFFEIIRELPDGPLELEKKDNNWLKVSQGRAVFNIVGVSPDEYPVFPTFSTRDFIKLDSDVFAEMIDKTIYSVSQDVTRYHLNGVYFEQNRDEYRMVATDGHRLSMVDRKFDGEYSREDSQSVIIPKKGLNEIRKLLDEVDSEIELAIEGSQLIVRYDRVTLLVRLIEGRYPNYQQLIPQDLKETVLVPRESLLSCLKRVSLLSNAKSKGITFHISSGRMEVTSNNPELGDAKEEIEVDYKGKDIKIGFNARYLLDILMATKDEIMRLDLSDQVSPGLVRSVSDDSYLCVVMPMRM